LNSVVLVVKEEKYTVKRVDGKLREHDRMTQYSSIRVTEHFFDMLNKLIRRFSTMKMEYFKGIDTFRDFPTIFRQLSDNFPTIFRQLSVNFPTNESKTPGLDPTSSRVTFFYSTTALH
jgi:hypothetical protein